MSGSCVGLLHASGVTRRDFLRRLGQLTLWGVSLELSVDGHAMASVIPSRIVVMDWPLTETLLELGVVPVGVSAPDWYRSGIVEPPLPSHVVDVGLLYSPNYEVLEELRPDLLIITPGHASARPLLERVAPTLTLGRYALSLRPYDELRSETMQMARAVGRVREGERLLENTDGVLDGAKVRLGQRPELLRRPVIVAEIVDERYLRVYGAGSLFDTMLSRIGVSNAANQPGSTGVWPTGPGGAALVSMVRLFELPLATLLIVGGIRASQRAALARNALWQALPAVRARRAAVLPVIESDGGLFSMQRFVLATEHALAAIADGRGGLG